ncbi:hypothetical protein [Rubrivirga marina]|uniref:DUF4153 domain-containing protein n=1 Tax=Rubrivirga marina TaxID=1196024 RepID=A0A271IXA3_9BACT|nr:hypothetical protein [Rubrivirga marina]PAP75822.1 hypothetical protein BSZ37_04875 [Rubrivirga marina]
MSPETILALRHEPQELEAAYRGAADGFARALAEALDRAPADLVLQAWAARLDLPPVAEGKADGTAPAWSFASVLTPERARALLLTAAALIVLGGTWAKLPWLLGWSESGELIEPFLARYAPFFVGLPLLGVLLQRYRPPARIVWSVGGALAALLLLQSFRDIDSDAGILSIIHLPILLLAAGGVLALGSRWQNAEARLAYLQFGGETAALAGVLTLGGGILLALTAALFEAIGVSVETVLFEWVIVYGAIGVLPVGALLASQRVEAGRLAPLVARVFGPMALVVLAVYLPTLVANGGLAERDSLLILNVALVAVLALVLLMEAERPDRTRVWTDGVAAALVALALLADLAALGSIVTRLAGGLTPNRLAIVGLNVLIAAHFAGLVGPLVRRALGRGAGPEDAWTARFLTVYALWALVVVLAFPVLF